MTEPAAGSGPPDTRSVWRGRITRTLAFISMLALVLVYALRGGSYDIVIRQEHGLIVWWVLALGIALGWFPRARPARPALALLGALAAYAAWTGLSLTWSESSERTFAELARVLGYLGVAALLVCAVDRRTWRPAAAGLGVGAMVVCSLALLSRLDPSLFPRDQAASLFRSDRLDYPFGYWNAVGAWGAMATALGTVWSAHDTSRTRRALALALVPVAALTTYLTYSRAGVGAIGLTVIVAFAFSRNRLTALVHLAAAAAGTALVILAVRGEPQIARATGTHGASTVIAALVFAAALCAVVAFATATLRFDRTRLPKRVARGSSIAAGVVVLVLAAGFGPHLATKLWHSFRHTTIAPSANPTARLTNLSGTRYDLWRVALHGFADHPTTGTGAGTFEFWWDRHARNSESVRNAHSLWLENMSELGTPGLLLIVAVTISAMWLGLAARIRSRRPRSAGITAAALAAFAVYLLTASVDWMWQSTAVTILALGGMAVLAGRLSGERTRLRLPLRAALVLAALSAAAVQLPGLISTTELRRSQQAIRAGSTSAALRWVDRAIDAEPWSASAYQQRALVLESEGQFTAAASDLRRAIDRQPNDFLEWLLLARVETEHGAYAIALRDYHRARELGRQRPVFLLNLTYGKF